MISIVTKFIVISKFVLKILFYYFKLRTICFFVNYISFKKLLPHNDFKKIKTSRKLFFYLKIYFLLKKKYFYTLNYIISNDQNLKKYFIVYIKQQRFAICFKLN